MVEKAPHRPLLFRQKSVRFIEGTKGRILGLSLIAFSLGEAAHVTRLASQDDLTGTDLKRSAVIFGVELSAGATVFLLRARRRR